MAVAVGVAETMTIATIATIAMLRPEFDETRFLSYHVLRK